MWSIGQVKAIGKTAFKANYWRCVLVAFLLSLLVGGTATYSRASGGGDSIEQDMDVTGVLDDFYAEDPQMAMGLGMGLLGLGLFALVVVIVLKIFVFNPIKVGGYSFLRANILSNGNTDLSELGSGFGNYGRTFLTLFLSDLFLALWFILFLIPGIVKSYSYRMVPYILTDYPELSPTEVITASRKMMDGHKWNTFLLDLSFIGWFILTALTLGLVGIFWASPYWQSTNAALYLELKNEQYN